MMVKLEITITQDKESPEYYCASAWVGDGICAGYGKDPFEALEDLIGEFREQEVWRPD
jgi:hypothetical protein